MVDAVRGLAVLTMITWHTADAWLEEPARGTPAFSAALIIGGLAAPLFLLLAGVSAALAEPTQHSKESIGAGVRRGIQIVVLGYALKLFAFGVDRGGVIGAHAPFVVSAALGLSLLHFSMGSLTSLPSSRRTASVRAALALFGLSAVGLGVAGVADDHSALDLMLRLDVLQGIGAALMVLAFVLPLTQRAQRPIAVLVLLSLAVAFATPPLAALDAHPSSAWLARGLDYVARLTPYPAPTSARFPIFPWLSYTLLGAAVGRWMMRGQPIRAPFGLPPPLLPSVALGLGGFLVLATFEAGYLAQLVLVRAEIFRNVVRLVWNASVALAFAGAIATFLGSGPRWARFIALLGRHSLLLYAVHLELAYGLPGVPLLRHLSFPEWSLAALLLTLAMGGLAHLVEWRAERARADRPPARRANPG